MASLTQADKRKFSRRIKDILEDADCRQSLKQFLIDHTRHSKLQILELYEKMSSVTHWSDEEIRQAIKNVDGIDYPEKATDKRVAVMEYCCGELEDVKQSFLDY